MTDRDPIIRMIDLGKSYRDPTRPENMSWALRHVTVDIHRGDVWGIIGRNGAGKSTLLKLVSRITRPSEGRFTIRGRVYSLLELGMGFHVELTGIDNLYVAGALQGISRTCIRRNLDSIVSFSGIGDAVYQPLWTYSSGMRVRLAFALAAHAHPDILILDEILAVGDEAFQRKCFEAIRLFLKQGVTVLFVSHDMKLVSLICSQCLLLQHGVVIDRGRPEEVIESYSRIIGPSISKGDLTLTRAGHYWHLFQGNFAITRRFGVYTSIRVHGVWYDPAYVLWDEERTAGDEMVVTGHYITVPLGMTWRFRFPDETTLEWSIDFHASEPVHLDRVQVNLMLNHRFSLWNAGDRADQPFPDDFLQETGEDWTRHYVGSPGIPIAASVRHARWQGRVEMCTDNHEGALAVVSSSPYFKSHLLQYLRVWPRNEVLTPGRQRFFTGRLTCRSES
ncbi:ABC transporter ATP-binding protein [bacterium]|nr:ABC transporter ATP-binding protein [candidate division CSSED10-310 bacterium]